MSALAKFLARNSVSPSGALPVIHSTTSYHLKHIRDSGKIIARQCDVFTRDKLNYFFVGRPAYKYEADSSHSDYWELPSCFIFEFSDVGSIRRVFPFDSGAFARKLYPGYVGKMPMEEFEASATPQAPERIIGAFFGTPEAYFKFLPKGKSAFDAEYAVGVFDEEIKALHRLAGEKTMSNFDDRRMTIEIQSEDDVDLSVVKPLAVIAPSTYYDDSDFLKHVETKWSAQPISYPIYPLSVAQYYALIYERVEKFFNATGKL